MTRTFPFALLLPAVLLLAQGCAPLAELEDENTHLRARIDTLEVLRESCSARLATLTQRITTLEQERILLEDRNKSLSERLAAASSLPTVTVTPALPVEAVQVQAQQAQTQVAVQNPVPASEKPALEKPALIVSKKGNRKSAAKNAAKAAEKEPAPAAASQATVIEVSPVPAAEPAAPDANAPAIGIATPPADAAGQAALPPVQAEPTRATGAPEAEDVSYRQAAVPSKDPAEESFLTRYQNALSQFHKRKYESALAGFSSLLAADVSNDMVDNAMYWRGECLSALGRHAEAAREYAGVIAARGSDKREAALMMRAGANMKLGRTDLARQDYRRLIELYPNGEYRAQAQQKLRALGRR